ncbi:hypothetical protein CLAFUW4_11616 [Fulvia fulva]|uniref:Uncharacterized protein n=1 Tax=Passalora fulva TaxID=5499 RepID=A0A9Q8PCV4_PASFU|nr:uncharacterized protein CLAFUR5_10661 [Fulvia fulva]KAK4619800.1 hypothetical protein CLAFUR4_11621 [Fulvia fulva]KAK4620437.1 hypothetical protein CLAFUR0_11630 [Fulvia fulva]UJO20090.1 hypothetical protein CLAFUR5_10661 [Fulvia fulva]WPV17194.1 hypothetical protein CLAFUW4_11616 [Fulvia fulva]WPV32569.1 hypothetical protein CLAFUW7_11620 [Fulvia fulva]
MTRHNISIKFFRGALQIMCTSQNATSVAKKARGAHIGTRLLPTKDKDPQLGFRMDCGSVDKDGKLIQIKMQANKNANEPSVSRAANLVHDVAIAVWDTEKDPDMVQLQVDLEESFEEIREAPKGQRKRSGSQSSQGKDSPSRSKSKSPVRSRSKSPTGGKGGSKGG